MDKRFLLDKINKNDYMPLKAIEMIEYWDLDESDKLILEKILDELVSDGLVFLTKKGRYMSTREKGLLQGTITTNDKGFGFFKDQLTQEEYFIPHNKLKDAQNRDTVLVSVNQKKTGKNKEANVERIIDRGTKSIIGEVLYHRGRLLVKPVDAKYFGEYRYQGINVAKGDRVFCRILEYPKQNRMGLVEGINLVSNIDDASLAIEQVMIKYDFAKEFPKSVMIAAEKVPQEINEEDIGDRKDLRELLMVTIDGEDAKDFDDAVSIERIDGGYRLGVHIADVSHYVQKGSAIDKEAYNRATSVYFPDRVIPMLPVSLSNGICSLNQGLNRMAMTAIMDIDKKGKIFKYDIFPSVIKVNNRMTYTNVAKILRRKEDQTVLDEIDKYKELFTWFDIMAELADILTKKREDRGSIFFDFPELKIKVDQKGKPIELSKRVRNQAETIIEEFMLAANETVAEHLYWLEAPCIYRVHEEPPLVGVNTFNNIAMPYGFKLKTEADGKIHPRQYQALLEEIKKHPMKDLLENLLLRSMSHARYDIKPLGHYGLSAVYYCHFTSPIRRYPDLEVHRILKRYIKGDIPNEKEKAIINYKAYEAAVQSSEQEIMAEEAERIVDRIKSVEYMKDYVGETFEGRISGMINSGLFVELDNLTEGFLPFFSLHGYHTFYQKEMLVRDAGNNVRFRIGDRVKVLLVKADILAGHLDFNLEEGELLD